MRRGAYLDTRLEKPEMPNLRIDSGLDINLVRTGPKGGTPVVFLHALGCLLRIGDGGR